MNAPDGLVCRTHDVHSALRQATRRTHLALHSLPQFVAIEAGRLKLEDYATLLGALHRFHLEIAATARLGGLLRLSSSPHRLHLLKADLASLGRRVAVTTPSFAVDGAARLHGALYVAEGSALGGRVISRQLDYLFGAQVQGRTFFAGAADAGPVWRAFLADMQAAWPDPADLPELVAGAEAAFALFADCVAA